MLAKGQGESGPEREGWTPCPVMTAGVFSGPGLFVYFSNSKVSGNPQTSPSGSDGDERLSPARWATCTGWRTCPHSRSNRGTLSRLGWCSHSSASSQTPVRKTAFEFGGESPPSPSSSPPSPSPLRPHGVRTGSPVDDALGGTTPVRTGSPPPETAVRNSPSQSSLKQKAPTHSPPRVVSLSENANPHFAAKGVLIGKIQPHPPAHGLASGLALCRTHKNHPYLLTTCAGAAVGHHVLGEQGPHAAWFADFHDALAELHHRKKDQQLRDSVLSSRQLLTHSRSRIFRSPRAPAPAP